MIRLKTPFTKENLKELHIGDEVVISGTIYAARDAAHKRMVEALERGESLPFDLDGQAIYYVGPCPAPPGKVIGSAGPTTSGRMDAYAPILMEKGLMGMIGKGPRNEVVISSIKSHGAVYFATIGGAGAYLAQKIISAECIAYPDLGPEALLRLEVEDFPCVVAVDTRGYDIYKEK